MSFVAKAEDDDRCLIPTWCQFHQHSYVRIFRTNVVSAAFFSYMYVVKAAETTFLRNIRT